MPVMNMDKNKIILIMSQAHKANSPIFKTEHSFKIKSVNSAIDDRQNKANKKMETFKEISKGLVLTATIEFLAKFTIAESG